MLDDLSRLNEFNFRRAVTKRIGRDLATAWVTFASSPDRNPATFHASPQRCPISTQWDFINVTLRDEAAPRPGTSLWMDRRNRPNVAQERIVIYQNR